jgi:hypothetical protein
LVSLTTAEAANAALKPLKTSVFQRHARGGRCVSGARKGKTIMQKSTGVGVALAAFSVLLAVVPAVRAQAELAPELTATGGPHDFDFEFGPWTAHLKRLVHPLTGSTTWVAYDGLSTVRRVWGGRADLGEFHVTGATGEIQGLSLRLYDPETHQWNVSWASANDGQLTTPLVGGFKNGRGLFFGRDTLGGKPIVARFTFSDLTRNHFHLEQAFSADDGKTWEVNWIADFTRVRARS